MSFLCLLVLKKAVGLLLWEGEKTVCVTEIVEGCSVRMSQGGESIYQIWWAFYKVTGFLFRRFVFVFFFLISTHGAVGMVFLTHRCYLLATHKNVILEYYFENIPVVLWTSGKKKKRENCNLDNHIFYWNPGEELFH